MKKFLITSLILSSLTLAAAAETLYLDDFSGAADTTIAGTNPDGALGATNAWTGATVWKMNGSGQAQTSGYPKNLFLPFSPEEGNLYTLSLDVVSQTGNDPWIALGFSATSGAQGAFGGFVTSEAPWMLITPDDYATFQGAGSTGGVTESSSYTSNTKLSIELDTNPSDWVAKYYLDGDLVRTITYTGSLAGNISYVGFGTNDTGPATREYIVDNFILTTVPEPAQSSVIGGVFSLMVLLLIRRRRSTAQ